MKTMNKIYKLLMMAAVLLAAGCYNDYDDPAPEKPTTKADMEAEGLQYISIGELKERFWAETKASDGSVASWAIDEPLYTRGKVITTDRYGSLYKSLFLYDEVSERAIELRLNSGNYLFYPAGRELFVRLNGLVLGNYRGMVSIGVASSNSAYSNDNLELPMLIREHISRGEQIGMKKSDTLVVNSTNYTSLSDNALGRIVRFEGIESAHGKAKWGYQNTFPNYFANSASYDKNSVGTLDGKSWSEVCTVNPTWGAVGKMNDERTDTYFYGSCWFSYDRTDAGANTNAAAGNYVVRTSGYAQFRDSAIPADGTVVDLTAIYTKYTNGSGRYVTYQLTLMDEGDVVTR